MTPAHNEMQASATTQLSEFNLGSDSLGLYSSTEPQFRALLDTIRAISRPTRLNWALGSLTAPDPLYDYLQSVTQHVQSEAWQALRDILPLNLPHPRLAQLQSLILEQNWPGVTAHLAEDRLADRTRFQALLGALGHNDQIRHHNFSNASFHALSLEELQSFCQLLSSSAVRHLSLSDTYLDRLCLNHRAVFDAIVQALSHNRHINTLNLSHNGLGQMGSEPINALFASLQTMPLRILNLASNLPFIPERLSHTQSFIIAVTGLLQQNRQFLALNLSANSLGRGLQGTDLRTQFLAGLSANTQLQHLELVDNYLNELNLVQFFEALAPMTQLELINLNRNQLSLAPVRSLNANAEASAPGTWIAAFGTYMRQAPHLRVLHLTGNGLDTYLPRGRQADPEFVMTFLRALANETLIGLSHDFGAESSIANYIDSILDYHRRLPLFTQWWIQQVSRNEQHVLFDELISQISALAFSERDHLAELSENFSTPHRPRTRAQIQTLANQPANHFMRQLDGVGFGVPQTETSALQRTRSEVSPSSTSVPRAVSSHTTTAGGLGRTALQCPQLPDLSQIYPRGLAYLQRSSSTPQTSLEAQVPQLLTPEQFVFRSPTRPRRATPSCPPEAPKRPRHR